MAATKLPRPDWMAKNDLMRELQERSSVEVRGCLWIVRGMHKTVVYDPVYKQVYVVLATSQLNPAWPPKVNAQRISDLVNCVPQRGVGE